MRLIDADALQTALVDEYTGIAGYKTRKQFYRAIEILRHQPTITPPEGPVVHGRWENGGCSQCGCAIPTDNKYDYIPEEVAFCPHCGAKMDLEAHHE